LSNWLEALRDRVIVRSQVSKRKLDAAFARRELDHKLGEVGRELVRLVRRGQLALPSDMASLVAEAQELEEKLEAQRAEIAALENEAEVV
jgi:hypothetical protein